MGTPFENLVSDDIKEFDKGFISEAKNNKKIRISNSYILIGSISICLLTLTAFIIYLLSTAIPTQLYLNNQNSSDEKDYQFSQFMVKYNKSYENFDIYKIKKEIWFNNLQFINNFNQLGHKSVLVMNQFGDLSNEEFKLNYLGYSSQDLLTNQLFENENEQINESDLPNYINWNEKGCVTPVKDQGQCGSCWAFSTTGAIESAVCIKTGELYSISEQQLIDCDVNGFNMGCNGGTMEGAFDFVINNNGLCTENDYPYEAIDDVCQAGGCTKIAPIKSFQTVKSSSIQALKKAIATHGPVSVALDGGDPAFRFYQGGVLSSPCAKDLDHAVLVVGYGYDNIAQQNYWYVKNSWGPMWGDDGYIKIAMNVMDKDGECGILLDATYPIV